MSRTIWMYIVGFAFISCNILTHKQDGYPKNLSISNSKGEPNDSLEFYFPATIEKDSQIIKTGIDTFSNDWYSCNLHAAKEPILYNYYLGYDIYRFLWLRSFHRPVIITFIKNDNKISLTIKELDRQPNFVDITYLNPRFMFTPLIDKETDSLIHPKPDSSSIDSIVKADRIANVFFNKTKFFTLKEWQEFEKLLTDCSFWTSQSTQKLDALDGSQWIIEGHLKNKYWFVDRWSPNDNFRKAGEYLINKSEFKEKIY